MSRHRSSPLQAFPIAGVLLFLVGASASGCATVPSASLGSAATLAKAGEAAATQMEQNVTISAQSLTLFRQAAAFNDGFNSAPGASSALIQNVQAIQKKLTQYGTLLQSLSSAYSAMYDLAEYGGSASLDSAMSSLGTDAQQFGKQIGKPITVSASVTKGLQEGGNVLVGSIQTEEAVKASAMIESVLKQVIAALSDPNVRNAMLPIQPELKGLIDQAAFTIYAQGAYSYRPILDALGAPLGLESVPNADAVVRGSGRLRAGLSAVVSNTVNSQIASAQQGYDQGLAALQALLKQHESLQAGQPVSVHNVLDLVSRLKTLAQVAAPKSAGETK